MTTTTIHPRLPKQHLGEPGGAIWDEGGMGAAPLVFRDVGRFMGRTGRTQKKLNGVNTLSGRWS